MTFAFLPIFLFGQGGKVLKWQNSVLLLFSLLFYAWGEPVYIVLMLLSIVFNYYVGIDIEENGLVTVSGQDPEKIQKALDWIRGLVEEPEVGKIYEGTVAGIKDFGAFVTILPGIDGMLHISQISDKRLKSVEEVLHMGDKVRVRLVAIDDKGRLSLTMKGLD